MSVWSPRKVGLSLVVGGLAPLLILGGYGAWMRFHSTGLDAMKQTQAPARSPAPPASTAEPGEPDAQSAEATAAAQKKQEIEALHAEGREAWRTQATKPASQQDARPVLHVMEQLCAMGEMEACVRIAEFSLAGDAHVPKDPARAERLLSGACDAKFSDAQFGDACFLLAELYRSGAGKAVPRDLKRAVAIYAAACDAKVGVACTNLGFLYEKGAGKALQPDPQKALALYTEACDAKTDIGCFDLGTLYGSGKGVSRDLGRALDLYTEACDLADGGTEKFCSAATAVRWQLAVDAADCLEGLSRERSRGRCQVQGVSNFRFRGP